MVETSAPPTKYGNSIIVQFMAMVKPDGEVKNEFRVHGSGQVEHQKMSRPMGARTVMRRDES